MRARAIELVVMDIENLPKVPIAPITRPRQHAIIAFVATLADV
ncbi:MAG: hypothetical protein AAGD11_13485 [Planctomycetota bacterium]